MNKLIIILILSGLLLPSFSFAQATAQSKKEIYLFAAQQQPQIEVPETLEEAKELGEKALQVTQKELPGTLEKIWKEEVLPIWQKMYDWFKINIWSKIETWFREKIQPRAKEEIEKRKPLIEEEFEKEKGEMKEEIKTEVPKVGKSLWEKFKEIIK